MALSTIWAALSAIRCSSGSRCRPISPYFNSTMSLSCSWISVLGFNFLSVDFFSLGALTNSCEGVDVFSHAAGAAVGW